MTFVYLDIETIPTQSDDVKAMIADTIKPPGSMKKAETIAAWEVNDKPQAAADAIAKTSFDPAFGHICTIGAAIGNDPVNLHHAQTVEAETAIIRAFFDSLPGKTSDALTFVGHYISGFDLRFILCRSVILGIPIPPCIPRDVKPWAQGIFDTMTAWAGPRDTIGQDKLAKALGMEGKGDFDGSMVAEAWANGEHETIIDYCARDVETVRNIHRRFVAVNW
jgi:hypothetical protein